MNEYITDEILSREMSILWQNLNTQKRNILGKLIRDYYNEGNRAELIINHMQEKIEQEV